MRVTEFTSRFAGAFERSNLTQQELALRLGVTQSTVSHWLTGRRTPTFSRIERIAAELGVDAAELAFGPRPRRAPVKRAEPKVEARAAS